MQRDEAQQFFEELQTSICEALESVDGQQRFGEDRWNHASGGGGRTRVIQGGAVFEQGGVNTSAVWGKLTDVLATRLETKPQQFFATGLSLVLHPFSPMIPTVHANFRYLELEDGTWWFGGGSDLTPFYLFEDDARHFHASWKRVCDRHDPHFYPRFKQWCDEYFFLRHRGEARGIGGIFFDYLKGDFHQTFAFVQECAITFLPAYLPIVERRRSEPWGDAEKEWQLLRRGRYVEFNLIYDRGTLFGLETGGRTESILMSLPPSVRWTYNAQPPGSREEALLNVLKKPCSWT